MEFILQFPFGAIAVAFALGVWSLRKYRRGQRQFNLRQMLCAIVLLSIPLAWYAYDIQEYLRERRAIEALSQANIDVQSTINCRTFQCLLVGSWAQQRAIGISANAKPMTPRELECLRDLRYVSFIRIHEGTFSDADLANLGGLRRLRTLTLRNCPITGAGLKFLPANAPLHDLDLHFCPIDDAALEQIVRWQSLRQLSLDGTNITDAGLEHLTHLNKLEHLSLNHTAVSDVGLRNHVSLLSRLRQVSLLNTEVSKDVGQSFTKQSGHWMPAPSAAHRIAARRLSSEGVQVFGTQFTENRCCVTIGNGWKHPQDAANSLLQLCPINQIHLRSPDITDADIALLKDLPELRVVMIEDTQITDRGLEAFSKQHHPYLRDIQIKSPQVTPRGVSHLAGFPSLEQLWLRSMQVSSKEIQHFAGLQHLRYLSFWTDPVVTDETAFRLQMLLPHSTVLHDTKNAAFTGGHNDADLNALGTPKSEQNAMHALREHGMYFESPNRAGQFRRAWGSTKNMEMTIEQLGTLPSLEELSISCQSLKSQSLDGLKPLAHLRKLSLYLQDFRALDISCLRDFPSLQSVEFTGAHSDEALASVDGLPNLVSATSR